MKKLATGLFTLFLVQGCVIIEEKPCEDVLEVKKQAKMCQKLRKQMNNREFPQAALTAKKRYEEACVNLRYYRDEYDTICGSDEKPIGKK